jgi:hypothetical protein
MASKNQSTFAAPRQWWKHLRDWKRFQHKDERNAAKKSIEKEKLDIEVRVCDTCFQPLENWENVRCNNCNE